MVVDVDLVEVAVADKVEDAAVVVIVTVAVEVVVVVVIFPLRSLRIFIDFYKNS